MTLRRALIQKLVSPPLLELWQAKRRADKKEFDLTKESLARWMCTGFLVIASALLVQHFKEGNPAGLLLAFFFFALGFMFGCLGYLVVTRKFIRDCRELRDEWWDKAALHSAETLREQAFNGMVQRMVEVEHIASLPAEIRAARMQLEDELRLRLNKLFDVLLKFGLVSKKDYGRIFAEAKKRLAQEEAAEREQEQQLAIPAPTSGGGGGN